jgi:uncharacterized protein YkwD
VTVRLNQPFPVECLEPRRLLSAVEPTALEQYAVELINRGRADPAAEAARYGIALNEGLNGQVISTAAKQPLAINPYLTDGARKHSQWLVSTNTFSHTGSGGSHPNDRMAAAGYTFAGRWWWGENIVWQSYNTASPTAALVDQMHQGLFVDTYVADRGHRINMMSPNFREIGAGFTSGAFQGWPAAGVLTTDFGTTAGDPFLTGVAYDDTVVNDHFYTPGEGLAGVTITATRAVDNKAFSTTTFASGGYSLALPAGTYRVTASGGSLSQPLAFGDVTIASLNVKADFIPGTTPVDTGTPPPPVPPLPPDPPPVTPPPPTGGVPGGGMDTTPPRATLTKALRQRSATRYYPFVVTYTDDVGVDPATFDNLDVFVTGPHGYSRNANFDHADAMTVGTSRTVTYVVKGPGGSWDASDNGVYTITLRRRQVRDTSGNPAGATVLGAFSARLPVPPQGAAVAPVTRGLGAAVIPGVFASLTPIHHEKADESVLA